jgi:hypothetical protein
MFYFIVSLYLACLGGFGLYHFVSFFDREP